MFIPVLLFIIGLLCLIFGGDWFVDGAVGIAHRLHLPELLIGATIVSIGTTLPEVMVSATSAASGHGQIAYGNAIGSIICNTALILAISLIFRPAHANRSELYLPVGFFFISALYYVFSAYFIKGFSRITGIIFLLMFVVYMAINVKKSFNKKPEPVQPDIEDGPFEPIEEEPEMKFSLVKDIFFLILGGILIAVGANLLVNNGTIIATGLGVPESVIALTFVALGTSLPELVTAITSIIKKHSDLSLGNIIGANLFNLVLVNGAAITISPFNVPVNKVIAGHNASLIIDIPLMILVMMIAILPAFAKQKLYRIQGVILLVLYAGFCFVQFYL